MLPNRCRTTWWALLILPVFAGCVSSVEPLSNEQTSVPDLRLLGTWEFTGEGPGKGQRLEVTPKPYQPNVLKADEIDNDEKKAVELLLTEIGDDHFVSVASQNPQGETGYIIARYELADDNLTVWLADTEFFAKAIEEEQLQGTVKPAQLRKDEEPINNVVVKDRAAELRAFLKEHGRKCFSAETQISFKRVADAK